MAVRSPDMIPNHLPLVVLLVVIPCDTACANDTKSPKPSELVRQLSWESIEGNCMGGSLCFRPGGEPAEKLVKMGEAANEALLSVLEDPKKGAAAHLILSVIHDRKKLPSANQFYFANVKYHYKDGDVVGWTYTFNGLSWSWSSGSGDSVAKAALAKNAETWRTRLAQK